MKVKELIQKLIDYSDGNCNLEVCSATGKDVIIGVLEEDASTIYLITIEAKKDLVEK